MARRKTNAEFVAEVKALVGDEYTFLGEYRTADTKIRVKHNKCGYEYFIRPSNFLNGTRCPNCFGKPKKTDAKFKAEVKALVGDEYVFLDQYKNSYTKIRVRHEECGHEYPVIPYSFLRGNRCPNCFGKPKKTDAKFKAEVKALVGDEYVFLDQYKNSYTKIRVKHSGCGYEYSVAPSQFLIGIRCPKCFRKTKKTDVDFKAEVKALVGDEYVFLDEYKASATKIRVKHNACGHVYSATPNRFLNGNRCPKCFGNSKKADSDFKAEVKALVGDEYVFLDEYKTSATKICVKHNICGHEYSVTPNGFLKGNRCPKCIESKGEKAVASFLESAGISYNSQYPIKYAQNRRPLFIDFLAAGVAIEYDGQQHFEAVEAWGGERTLRETQRRDRIKNEYCAKHGIPMIRIPYWDFDRIDEILTEKLLPLIRNKDDKLA